MTLTTLLPLLYEPLVHGGPWMAVATVILVLRNLAMVVFLVRLVLLVGRTLRRGQTSRAARRRAERAGTR